MLYFTKKRNEYSDYTPLCTHLEACGSWFAWWYICLIMDFEFRHHSNDSLDDESDDVRPDPLDVDAFSCQPVQHTGERALAARVLAVRVDEVATVDVEGVVSQVHEDMAQVLLAWLLYDDNGNGFNSETMQKQKYKSDFTRTNPSAV